MIGKLFERSPNLSVKLILNGMACLAVALIFAHVRIPELLYPAVWIVWLIGAALVLGGLAKLFAVDFR